MTTPTSVTSTRLLCAACPSKPAAWCKGCPRETTCHFVDARLTSPADVIIVSEAPVIPKRFANMNAIHSPYTDEAGSLVNKAISTIRADNAQYKDLRVQKTYAVLCTDADPSKEVIDRCKTFLQQGVQLATRGDKTPIIVAMGMTAVKALGIKAKSLKEVQSRVLHDVPINGTNYTVLVTISTKMLAVMAGMYTTFTSDLKRAMDMATTGVPVKKTIEELTSGYRFPKTVDEVRDLCREIINYSEEGTSPENWVISVDTETNTLFPHRDGLKLLCVSVAWATGCATAIPLWHKETPYDPEAALPYVQELLDSAKPKTFHNVKYDGKVFRKRDLRLNNVRWDSLLGEHALEEDKKGQYGLKPLTRVFFPEFTEYADELHGMLEKELGGTQLDNIRKQQAATTAEIAAAEGEALGAVVETATTGKAKKPKAPKKKKGQETGGFENIPLDTLLLYAAVDTDITRRLTLLQLQRIKREEAIYRARKAQEEKNKHRKFPVPQICTHASPVKAIVTDIAVPLTQVLGVMEYRGIRVDRPYLEYVDEQLGKAVEETQLELHALAQKPDLKLNSAAAIANVLFNEGFADPVTGARRVYEPVTLTQKNQAQTTEKVLKFLVAKHGCPFSSKLLIYKKAYKAKNTFIANVRDLSALDGFLHTNYNVAGTGTGRLSSHDENMQNIPKKLAGFSLKKIFVPDDESMAFVNCDAKGAEVRIFSAYSQDQELIRSLNDGLDTHCFFADAIVREVRLSADAAEVLASMGLSNDFPLTYEDFNNRDRIKATNPVYGEMMDKFRTAIKRVVFGILYGAGPRKIAETIGINLSQAQAIIDMLFRLYPSIPAYIERTKWELNTFGLVETFFGRRRRFSVKGATGFLRSRAERQGVNFKIQSTSSDIVMQTLIAVDPVLTRDLRGRVLLTVHDSLGFQVPKKYASQLPEFVDRHLNVKASTRYPWLPVDFKWDLEVGPSYGELQNHASYMAQLTPEDLRDDVRDAYTEEEVRTELASVEDH
jgi:DNA polymerase I-like protein with 3'-5' exonuclease and polymerase domains